MLWIITRAENTRNGLDGCIFVTLAWAMRWTRILVCSYLSRHCRRYVDSRSAQWDMISSAVRKRNDDGVRRCQICQTGGESSVAAPPQGGEGEQHSIARVNNNINGMASFLLSSWIFLTVPAGFEFNKELDDDTPHDSVGALMLQP